MRPKLLPLLFTLCLSLLLGGCSSPAPAVSPESEPVIEEPAIPSEYMGTQTCFTLEELQNLVGEKGSFAALRKGTDYYSPVLLDGNRCGRASEYDKPLMMAVGDSWQWPDLYLERGDAIVVLGKGDISVFFGRIRETVNCLPFVFTNNTRDSSLKISSYNKSTWMLAALDDHESPPSSEIEKTLGYISLRAIEGTVSGSSYLLTAERGTAVTLGAVGENGYDEYKVAALGTGYLIQLGAEGKWPAKSIPCSSDNEPAVFCDQNINLPIQGSYLLNGYPINVY